MQVKFDDSIFSSLILADYETQWNNVPLSALDEDEQAIYTTFLSYLPDAGAEQDPEKMLLVKAADGVLERVYGPTLFRTAENDLILKIGDTTYPVNQDGTAIICGNLRGSVDFEGDKRSLKVKDSEGKEVACEVQDCVVTFMVNIDDSHDENIYAIAIRTNPLANPTSDRVRVALAKKRPFADFLAEPTQGGGNFTQLKKLDVGREYEVVDSYGPIDGKFGPEYYVVLSDGQKVRGQAKLLTILNAGKVAPKDFNAIIVTKIEEKGDKTYVTVAVRKRGAVADEPVVTAPPVSAPKGNSAPGKATAPAADEAAQPLIPF